MAKRTSTTITITADELALLRRHISLSRDVLQRYANLAELAIGIFDRQSARDSIMREWFEELSQRIAQLERLQLYEKIGNVPMANQVRQEIDEDVNSVQRRLRTRIRNLNYLQEQAAEYGNAVPLHIINEIADEQAAIQELQRELDRQRK